MRKRRFRNFAILEGAMDKLLHDVRYALRLLLKAPGFTAIAVTALALGIGANTAIFSVVNAALLRPMPYKDADRIVLVWSTDLRHHETRDQVSATDVDDYRQMNHVFADVATFADWTPIVSSGSGDAERLSATQVGDGYFNVVQGSPLLGRVFLPEEQIDGKDTVVILSYGLWQRRFGGDP